jgi:alanine racemase
MTTPPDPGAPGTLAHPAWIEVDLEVLAANARVLRAAIPDGAALGILVKANAYGHGLVPAARAALAGGADVLVVAALGEALVLREAGVGARILVVYPVDPAGLPAASGARVELSVSGLESAQQLADAWRGRADADAVTPGGARLQVHVEVDSGMARGGALPGEVLAVLATLDAAPGVEVAGLWSHLADGGSASIVARQVAAFEDAAGRLRVAGRPVPPRHLAATEGLLAGGAPVYDMARIGLAFYGELGVGVTPAPALAAVAALLRPALALKARAVHLGSVPEGGSVGYGGEWVAGRPSRIATLPVGYADGWARSSWPHGSALVRGRRVPIAGRVSMDSVCVDVTDVPGVGLDDEFVLLGRQGSEVITVDEVARARATIANEVLATLGPRLPRVYRGGDAG